MIISSYSHKSDQAFTFRLSIAFFRTFLSCPYLAHVVRLAGRVLDLELLVQRLDVVFDALDQLGLVLANGAADVRSNEERVETREDAEHLIGVLRSAEQVTQAGRDARLDAIDSLVIALGRRLPHLNAFLGHVQAVHLLDDLVGEVNLRKEVGVTLATRD